jgi:sporulation-control protein
VFSGGSDAYRLFEVDHATAEQTDWTGYLRGWLHEIGGKRGW